MKNTRLLCLVALGLFFFRCTHDGSTSPAPVVATPAKVDFDAGSIKIMDELTPQLTGTWTLRQVQVRYQPYNNQQKKLQLTKDTLLQNLATLTIRPAAKPRRSPKDPRHAEFDGTIAYGGKTYPIYFSLLASPDRIITNTGPQAFFLFEYSFPNGTRVREPEETFLDNLGVIEDNFSLETIAGQPGMVWHGLNRGVDRMELQKQ